MGRRSQRAAMAPKASAEELAGHPLEYVADLPPSLFAEWLAGYQPISYAAWCGLPLRVRIRLAHTDGVVYRFAGTYGASA